MKAWRAVALDLDGVVVDRRQRVTLPVRDAVLRLYEAIPLVYITGRPTDDAEAVLQTAGLPGRVLGENGGPVGSSRILRGFSEADALAVARTMPGAVVFPQLHEPGYWAVEVSHSKGDALRTWAGSLGIPLACIAAVGDSTPDIPMLQAAGLGIAMGHAPASVQQVADVVVPSVDEDGLVVAVRDYILTGARYAHR